MFCVEMQDSRLPESDLEAIGCLQENKYIPAWLDVTYHNLSPQLILSPIKSWTGFEKELKLNW